MGTSNHIFSYISLMRIYDTNYISFESPNTVVFFKLDRGDSLLDGKMSKIMTLGEMILQNV